MGGFQIKSVTKVLNQDSQVMEVKRLILDPNIISPEFTHTDIYQLLYVIKRGWKFQKLTVRVST
ncbi:MAG: hypothetical protein Ct9H300mP28_08870 [Pseudomonadota bacterium]|nr:MAG: hypothetical protein Ct9H300mP28_08870 [Pseudomonadota bacterium]